MPTAVLSILSLLQYAPQAVTEINSLYQAIKGTFSPNDQATIDAALAKAIADDAASTAAADTTLDAAAKR